MKLFYRESGQGNPLVILHGLYGSSDNWMSIAKELEKYFRVINVDQRNHGQSPHSDEHSYALMADDLLELFDELKLEKANIIAHSMGGKVAMRFAYQHPERILSIVVVDIAPWGHFEGNESSNQIALEHKKIIEGLNSIPLYNLKSRNEADSILAHWVKGDMIRQFLLKNLKREHDGSFRWKLNLMAISNNISNMMEGFTANLSNKKCDVRTLFIKGTLSNYIQTNKEEFLGNYFTNSSIVKIDGAGHWVHAEKPKEFIDAILDFLNNIKTQVH